MRVSDTSPDYMPQQFICLRYDYSLERGPGCFMGTRGDLRTVSQYKIEADTVYGPWNRKSNPPIPFAQLEHAATGPTQAADRVYKQII